MKKGVYEPKPTTHEVDNRSDIKTVFVDRTSCISSFIFTASLF